MHLKIYDNYQSLSEEIADEVIRQIKAKPESVLCLAAGDTPRLAYNLLAKKIKEEPVDLSQISIIGLDEWVGIPPENEGSCQFFLKHELLDHLNLSPSQIHLFNSLSDDLTRECWIMDETIKLKGGIDLMIVGVGMNGHIGFNEPGVDFGLYSHVIDLDDTTQSVGQKYFKQNTTLKKGITLGLGHLSQSKKVILIANGKKKAEVIRNVVEGPVDPEVPASIMQTQENGWVMIDEEAGSKLADR